MPTTLSPLRLSLSVQVTRQTIFPNKLVTDVIFPNWTVTGKTTEDGERDTPGPVVSPRAQTKGRQNLLINSKLCIVI